MKCEGWCDDGNHEGAVVSVIVYDRYGPLRFNYCEYAIELDRKNGFTVEVVEP